MDGHLFRDIIVTEGANLLYTTVVDELNIYTEYYQGRSQSKVAIIVDPNDDEIDCITGSTILKRLGMDDIITLLFPNPDIHYANK